MAKILLFDIDNTLLFTGGAGTRAMNLAFEQLYGVHEPFAGIAFAGRTDQAILRDGFVKHGIIVEGEKQFRETMARFQEAYYLLLQQTLRMTDGGRVLPGVVDLLEHLAGRDDSYLGIATGNFRHSAMLKLDHYGLRHYFLEGGYGDDAEDRAELVALASRRLAGLDLVAPGAHEIFVFGDTPYDVRAATTNRFYAVGVATGGSSEDELRRSGAHHVFPDLSRTAAVLSVLGMAPIPS